MVCLQFGIRRRPLSRQTLIKIRCPPPARFGSATAYGNDSFYGTMGRTQKRALALAHPVIRAGIRQAESSQSSLTGAGIATFSRQDRDTGQKLASATRRPASDATRQQYAGSISLDGRHRALFTYPCVTEGTMDKATHSHIVRRTQQI